MEEPEIRTRANEPLAKCLVVGDGESLADYFGNVRILGDLTRNEDEPVWTGALGRPQPAKLVVWLGCNIVRTAHIAEALDDILQHMGVDYAMLGGPAHCCGIVHQSHGHENVADRMVRHTMGKFDQFKPEQLLYWCPSCDERLEGLGENVTATASARMNVASFLENIIPASAFVREIRMTAVLHGHGDYESQRGDNAAIRRLLARIPGLKLVEPTTESEGLGRHCTVAAITEAGKEHYDARIGAWAANAREVGATHIVSIYHSCHRQIMFLQGRSPEVASLEVVNYVSLVAEALGLAPRNDRFGELARLSNTDERVAHLRGDPAMRGVSETLTRRAISDQFEKHR